MSKQQQTSEWHIVGIALAASALLTAFGLLNQFGFVSVLFSITASGVFLASLLVSPSRFLHTFHTSAFVLIAFSCLAAQTSSMTLLLVLAAWAILLFLAIPWKVALVVFALGMVSAGWLHHDLVRPKHYLFFGAFAGFGAYLRWLLLAKDAALVLHSESDSQTGCRNIGTLFRDAEQYFLLQRRYGIPCALLVIDADYESSSLDEQYRLLDEAVSVWSSRLRKTDLLYKVSDHRFICLATATEFEQVDALVKDIERATNAFEFSEKRTIQVDIKAYDSAPANRLDDWLEPVSA